LDDRVARILVGLSGGVDSAVAALLLKREGHDVHGAHIRTWRNEEGLPFPGECPWETDQRDAEAVARTLGIPFRSVDLIDAYREVVVDYLVDGYARGLTPNPDIVCNREMKFGAFLRVAQAEGFEALGTGHYARRVEQEDGSVDIRMGVDRDKDQTYFLALNRQEQMRAARFPVGELHKAEVRRLAAEAGLPNADRKDSQGICFLGQVRIQDFLERHIPDAPGPIVNGEGKVIGEHRGLHRFTLGQRKGIGLPSNTDHEHFVVVAKDLATRTLRVAFDRPGLPGLYTDQATLGGLSWIRQPVEGPRDLLARVRHRDPAVPARFTPVGEGTAEICFSSLQRGLAPGQVVALYEGESLLGGGVLR
jgi:tRNA-specific 2-thiouridylase